MGTHGSSTRGGGAEAAGREVIPGEAGERGVLSRKMKGVLPGLDEFRAAGAKTTATPSKEVPTIPPETISQAEATTSL